MAEKLSKGSWKRTKHLALISKWLVTAAYGKLPKGVRGIIVNLPPRHGKSILVSQWFPAWFLEMFPDKRVMLASYERGFAAEWGGKVRDTLVEHEKDLTARVKRGAAASAGLWETTRGGSMLSTGMQGSQTGRGTNCLIIDDPVRDAVQADSAAWRRRVWSWWERVGSVRLEPGAFVVLCMTRWHTDDLAGRLIAESRKGGDKWIELVFPALCEVEQDELGRKRGQALWPERYDEAELETRKRHKRAWNSLFRQQPSDDEGNIFRDSWWKYWRPRLITDSDEVRAALPQAFDRVIGSWDCSFKGAAQKKSHQNDEANSGLSWVVGTVWGKRGEDVYLLGVYRGQWGFNDTVAQIKSMKARWPQLQEIYIEDKANGSAIIETIAREVPGVVAANVEGDKVARAHATTFPIESGNVWLPEHAEWIDAYMSELSTFPYGTADDQVDSTTQALSKLYGGNSFSLVL